MDKLSAGRYVCEATNAAGSGSSDEVQLNVKCMKKQSYTLSIRLKLIVMENNLHISV